MYGKDNPVYYVQHAGQSELVTAGPGRGRAGECWVWLIGIIIKNIWAGIKEESHSGESQIET